MVMVMVVMTVVMEIYLMQRGGAELALSRA